VTEYCSDTSLLDKTVIKLIQQSNSSQDIRLVHFLPARRYASAGYRDRNVSVRPSVRLSVCLSVRHAPVLCRNEES